MARSKGRRRKEAQASDSNESSTTVPLPQANPLPQQPKKENPDRPSQIHPDRLPQIRQGDYYGDQTSHNLLETNTHATVSSWRSQGNVNNHKPQSGASLQNTYEPSLNSSLYAQQQGPRSLPQKQSLSNGTFLPPLRQQTYTPSQLGQLPQSSVSRTLHTTSLALRPSPHAEDGQYKPHDDLRSVHSYTRYPLYRVNKPYRAIPHQSPAAENGQSQSKSRHNLHPKQLKHGYLPPELQDQGRYRIRSKQPGQTAARTTADAGERSSPLSSHFLALGTPTKGKATVRRRYNTPEVKGPPAPTPTKEYQKTAELRPMRRESPQKLLVILDLNGTLLVRPKYRAPQSIKVRPGVAQLLEYLFENHAVMVYSSTRPENCLAIVDKFFQPHQTNALAAIWARNKLGLSAEQYNNKVQVYKKLDPIWADEGIQTTAAPGERWSQQNTVLVDDSQLKALAQPHNLLQIPEFVNNEPQTGTRAHIDWYCGEEDIVKSVQEKLEELKWQVDVSRLIRQWQTGEQQAPGVVDETVDQRALQRAQGHDLDSGISDRGSSATPQPLESPEASFSTVPTVEKNLPQYQPLEVVDEDDAGVSADDEGGVTIDDLEREINRNLSLNQDSSPKRVSVQPQIDGAALAVGTVATAEAAHS